METICRGRLSFGFGFGDSWSNDEDLFDEVVSLFG